MMGPWKGGYDLYTNQKGIDINSTKENNIKLVEKLIYENYIPVSLEVLGLINVKVLNTLDRNKYFLYSSIIQLRLNNKSKAKSYISKVNINQLYEDDLYHYFNTYNYLYFNEPYKYIYHLNNSINYLNIDINYVSHLILKYLASLNSRELNKKHNIWFDIEKLRRSSPLKILDMHDLSEFYNLIVKYPDFKFKNLFVPLKNKRYIKKIAIILPLSGKLSYIGKKIQDGFMDEYFKVKTQIPEINIYDSNDKDIINIYNKAKKDGAEIIVGPLEKDHLKKIKENSSVLSVPTIALNYTDNNNLYNNLFEFGLDLTQEIQQIALEARKQGNQRILLISDNSDFMKDLNAKFIVNWNKLNGRVIDNLHYVNLDKINVSIQKLLHINESKLRYRNLVNNLDIPMKHHLHMRDDFDSVMIIANNQDITQIYPSIKYYLHKNIKIYSLSIANNIDTITQNKYLELNDLFLYEVNQLSSISFNNSTWNDSLNSAHRLFSLGQDAFKLSCSILSLEKMPYLGFYGSTGYITVKNNRIYRSMYLSRISNGKLKTIEP